MVGAVALVVALALALLPLRAGPSPAATGTASLPERFADYSYLTGDVAASPPGRAIALYQHGWDVEFMDYPQAVMAGADGDVYRRVGVAERRAGGETQGDPAPMLLSPAGLTVAVGDYVTSAPDIALLDLPTGRVVTHAVPGGRSTIPLAWSPDSELLVYLSTEHEVNPYSGSAISGDIGVLDVGAGTGELLPGEPDARAVAFSPDGSELAVHRITPDDGSLSGEDGIPRLSGGVVEIIGSDGAVHRELPLPPGLHLIGPNAWSPDGALLATGTQFTDCMDLSSTWAAEEWDELAWDTCWAEQDALVFLDATGEDGTVPPPLPFGQVGNHGLLGWTSTKDVLVLDDVPEPGEDATELYWLTAVPLDGADPQPISAVPGGGNYGIGSFHLATGLLPDLEVREVGDVDRGRWPLWMRVGTALVVAVAALLVARAFERRSGLVR